MVIKIKYKGHIPKELKIGTFLIFKIKKDDLLIQPNLQIITLLNKTDFLCWSQSGAIYRDDEPHDDGLYSFYAFSETMCVIYRQKEGDLI